MPGGLKLDELHACMNVLGEQTIIGLEVAEEQAKWPDSSECDCQGLLAAIMPRIQKLQQGRL